MWNVQVFLLGISVVAFFVRWRLERFLGERKKGRLLGNICLEKEGRGTWEAITGGRGRDLFRLRQLFMTDFLIV